MSRQLMEMWFRDQWKKQEKEKREKMEELDLPSDSQKKEKLERKNLE